MKRKKRKRKDYQPYDGFHDLRKFNLPDDVFMKLWRVQEFLYLQNQKRDYLRKYAPLEWEKLKDLSAQYQLILLQYDEIE